MNSFRGPMGKSYIELLNDPYGKKQLDDWMANGRKVPHTFFLSNGTSYVVDRISNIPSLYEYNESKSIWYKIKEWWSGKAKKEISQK